MVNEPPSTRARLLSCLRREEGFIPGTRICDELGISRVAVWKQVESLKAAGYLIESDHRGYRIIQEGDFLQPWEFPECENRLVHYDQTDSTMERALGLALEGSGREWIVVAESQKKGRGRRGRSWKSEPGGLFCTFVLYPDVSVHEFAKPLLAAGIALCQAVREQSGEEACLEWPNDLYLSGKKIAGLLPEFMASGESLRFFDLGLGVNVDNRVAETSGASLASLTGRRISRGGLLKSFMKNFEPFKENNFSQADLAELWWKLSSSGGKRAVGPDGEALGCVQGIAKDGSLLVDAGIGGLKAYGLGKAAIRDKEKKK
jgi:BirA family transcriptional regulator, biotin operon repressor / biotin---[acetyl-CoA-carboxylase] ligase